LAESTPVTADTASLTRRLRLLGNQMMLLAADVANCHRDDAGPASASAAQVYDDSDLWLVAAEDMYRERRRRSEFLPQELFGEPAWDILLDLYIAEKKNERVSVTSACIGSQVPCTTGLRWLQVLEELGLVERERDERDGRRWFVRITDGGYARMTRCMAALRDDWRQDDILAVTERQREIAAPVGRLKAN
jgi:DNA-binding MarR family transcriptional regulator